MDPALVVQGAGHSLVGEQRAVRVVLPAVGGPLAPLALDVVSRLSRVGSAHHCLPLQGPAGERGEQGAPGPSGFQVGSWTGFLFILFSLQGSGVAQRPSVGARGWVFLHPSFALCRLARG